MIEVCISGGGLMHTVVLQKIRERIDYIFLRRTSGGAHIWLLLDEQGYQQFKTVFPKIKQEYEEYERKHNRRATVSYTVEQVPKDIDAFFKKLREYIDLDYRINGNVIEVAVEPHRVGQFIGRGGRKIKAMQKLLGKRIRVVQGVKAEGIGKPYFTGYRDPKHGYFITWGYVAPWKFDSS